MAGGVDLLRLLEPVVRPGGLPGPSSAPKAPIESRSFDSILEEARTGTDTSSTTQSAGDGEVTRKVDPLQSLSQVDLIENPTLLKLFDSAAVDSNRSA